MGVTVSGNIYKVKGCDLLLIDIHHIRKQGRKVGCNHIIDGNKYVTTHVFHDCIAIQELGVKDEYTNKKD